MMSTPPRQDQAPPPHRNRRLWLMVLTRVGLPLVALTLLAIAGGLWYGHKFLREQLSPSLQTNLSKLLNRPINIGPVEQMSFSGLRLGKSALPATAQDPDRITVEGIEVGVNLWQCLLDRKLTLDTTLLKPQVYIAQNRQGNWVDTQIQSRDDVGVVPTELRQVRFRDARLELVATPKPGKSARSVVVQNLAGVANFADNHQRITYDLTGDLTGSGQTGQIALQGETLTNSGLTSRMQLQGQNLAVVEVDRLIKLPIYLSAGQGSGNFDIELPANQDPIVKGTADFQNLSFRVPKLPQSFSQGKGQLRIDGSQITLDKTQAQIGEIPFTAQGKIDTEKGFDLDAQVTTVPVAKVLKTFDLAFPLPTAGEVTATAKLTGALLTPILTGKTRSLRQAKVDQIELRQASADFRLDTRTLKLAIANIQGTPEVGGQVSGQGQVDLNAPGAVNFNLRSDNLPGDAIAKLYNRGQSPGFKIGTVKTQAQIRGAFDTIQTIAQWQAPQAQYPATGTVIVAQNGNATFKDTVAQVAGGTINASGQTIGDRWQASVKTNNLPIAPFLPQIPGQLQGEVQLQGTIRSFAPKDIQAQGTARIAQANGSVNAKINARGGRWTAKTQITALPLSPFSSDLRGALGGDLLFTGAVDALKPSATTVAGTVNLSQGIALINQPIAAQIRWDGRQLNLDQATASGFRANGVIQAQLDNRPEITGLDLAVQATGYNLSSLPIPRPPVTQLQGQIDLNGRIKGTPTAPQVMGDLRVRSLALNGIAFDPLMQGNFRLNPQQGFAIQAQGDHDRLALNLAANYRPRTLLVKRDQATIVGQARGNLFQLTAQRIPLDGFVLPATPLVQVGQIGGLLSGQFNIDLNQLRITDGTAAVEKLKVGAFYGDRLQTQFVNQNNIFRFRDTLIRKGSSQYALGGELDLRSSPQFSGQLAVTQGKLEDILQGLQIFSLEDFTRGLATPTYQKAADLHLFPAGRADASLADQLRRLAEINTKLNQTAQARQKSAVPQLADIRGRFDGTVKVAATQKTGLQVGFNLTGNQIQWRPYPGSVNAIDRRVTPDDSRVLTVEKAFLIGNFNNGVLNLSPLRLQSGEAQINLSGNFGGKTQSGQIIIQNLPIEQVRRFYPSPLGFGGKLNANATISGTRNNPAAIGFIQVADGTLNQTKIQSATGNFNYLNSRLKFGSTVAIQGPEPIRLEGSIPYQFPFSDQTPDSRQVSLKANLKNEGLALFNLLTPQITWVDGQGEVKLEVAGELPVPKVTGIATLRNAKIKAQALPELLTDVNGTAYFDTDRIRVEQLQGQFSRGQVMARGVLPILLPLQPQDPDFANPLSLSLNQIALNLEELYKGGVDGSITLRGSALVPEIGGEIRLSKGQVFLPGEAPNETAASEPIAGANPAPASNPELSPTLNQLRLSLADRVQIMRKPIVNFTAKGDLTVNGTLDAPKPEGTIRLTSGQVNLFTTQFVLANNATQTATFSREFGLDPTLDLSLVASLPEITRNPTPRSNTVDLADTSLLANSVGAVETVRIQARATGRASNLASNLALTSSPTRSRNEIIALIGGGFVNDLGRGDSSTLGIANLAGSAVLTNIQGFIGNAIGANEFRLFPTLLRNNQNRGSTLGVATELGFDLTKKLSGSVLKVLTDDQLAQFGMRYRINDSLLFRGSTDFSGGGQAVFEFDIRF